MSETQTSLLEGLWVLRDQQTKIIDLLSQILEAVKKGNKP